MNHPLSKNIAFAYFSGLATPLQKKLIADWMREEKNLEQYYQWLEEWENEHPQFVPDVDQALHRYLSRMEGQGSEQEEAAIPALWAEKFSHPRPKLARWWMLAAALLVGVLAFALAKERMLYCEYSTAYGEVKSLQLEDGSLVTLNAHSTLLVPRFGFGSATREVFLQGEAEFIITHTIDNQRFVVKTPDQLEVEVLGTEFIVNTRAKGTKVVLSKGKVKLKSPQHGQNRQLTMRPGDIVLVDKSGTMDIKVQQPLQAHTAWKEHRFVFHKTSLLEVTERINETFGVQVLIPDTALAKRAITGNYKADNADELLRVLAELLDMQLSKRGEEIILSAR